MLAITQTDNQSVVQRGGLYLKLEGGVEWVPYAEATLFSGEHLVNDLVETLTAQGQLHPDDVKIARWSDQVSE